jgi:hypothetical protein
MITKSALSMLVMARILRAALFPARITWTVPKSPSAYWAVLGILLSGESMKTLATQRKGERGQTIAIVAITLVALIGFAALGIEVVALYVAHAEAQRTQLGITETPSAGKFTAAVMNAVGCDSGAAGNPISARTTPVGVRLIHQ